MRDYARVSGRFWTGQTGRQLRGDPEAQVAALYLMTSPSSNMTGLYYLPLPTMCHEAGISPNEGERVIQRLEEVGFARYDHRTETIWVVNMCRWQIGKDELPAGDNRIKGIVRELGTVGDCALVAPFLEKYADCYRLPLRRVAPPPSKGSEVASPTPSKPSKGASTRTSESARTGAGDGANAPSAADAAPPPPVVELVDKPDPPPARAAPPEPTPPTNDPAAVAAAIRSHPWFGQVLDVDVWAQQLCDGWPELDVAKQVRQAISKLTPDEVKRRSGANGKRGGPSGYVTAWLDKADQARIVTAAKAAAAQNPDGKTGTDRLREAIRRASA